MAVLLNSEPVAMWSGDVDEDNYRTYKVTHLVLSQGGDGPANVLRCPGLPRTGSPWIYGNDVDVWVWCRPNKTVQLHNGKQGEIRGRTGHDIIYAVESTYSNKPLKQCHEYSFEDPILEPPKVSGSFVTYQEEATHDRFNRPIVSSSWEQIRGPSVEFDRSRPTVEISMNVLIFSLPLVAAMMDTVNDSMLWGLYPRMIKLSRVSWERLFYGECYVYYRLNLGFDVNYDTFDRIVQDEGQKVLSGYWNPSNLSQWVVRVVGDTYADPLNPNHFIKAVDPDGNPMHMVLDGYGKPAGTLITSVDPRTGQPSTGANPECSEIGNILIQRYHESNFLLLGIPTIF